MIPRIFDGGEAIVVAGGTSLRGFSFASLSGRNTIAINRAFEVMPDASVLWWTDARFFRRFGRALLDHASKWKATGNYEYQLGELPRPPIEQYLFTGEYGFDEHPEHLRHGWNSAYAATHLAVHLGAVRVILLGVDLYHGDSPLSRNFHDGYGVGAPERDAIEKWRTGFEVLAPILKGKGVEVINGSPKSALTVWPRCSIADALAR